MFLSQITTSCALSQARATLASPQLSYSTEVQWKKNLILVKGAPVQNIQRCAAMQKSPGKLAPRGVRAIPTHVPRPFE